MKNKSWIVVTGLLLTAVGATARAASLEDAGKLAATIKFDRETAQTGKSSAGRRLVVIAVEPHPATVGYEQKAISDAMAATRHVTADAMGIGLCGCYWINRNQDVSDSQKARELDRDAFFMLGSLGLEDRAALRGLSGDWVVVAAESLAALDRITLPKDYAQTVEYKKYRASVVWAAEILKAVYGDEFVRPITSLSSVSGAR